MTEKVEPTELDKELQEKANAKKETFIKDMVMYRSLYLEDESNDYFYFLYLASIMNFVEYHNGGCLTDCGMKSLELNISPYIQQIQTGEPKLCQKDLVRFLLNLLNSYAISFLSKGLFEFCKEDEVKFFELNDFPTAIREDFEKLKALLHFAFLDSIRELGTGMNAEKFQGLMKSTFGDGGKDVVACSLSFLCAQGKRWDLLRQLGREVLIRLTNLV
jgi:hypothetical protein